MKTTTAAFLIGLLGPVCLGAQEEPAGPVVRVVGTATEQVPPDHAVIAIGVRIQAATAEGAADAMSDRIVRVVDTLVALGFSRDSLPTRVFSVEADRDYSQGNRIAGYTAALQVNLRTSELDRVAEFIGAALSAGATEIGRIRFASTETAAAREVALRRAVEAAEREATIIAEAQGGALGALLEVSTEASGATFMPYLELELASSWEVQGAADLTVTPQLLPVTARVTASWRLR